MIKKATQGQRDDEASSNSQMGKRERTPTTSTPTQTDDDQDVGAVREADLISVDLNATAATNENVDETTMNLLDPVPSGD